MHTKLFFLRREKRETRKRGREKRGKSRKQGRDRERKYKKIKFLKFENTFKLISKVLIFFFLMLEPLMNC